MASRIKRRCRPPPVASPESLSLIRLKTQAGIGFGIELQLKGAGHMCCVACLQANRPEAHTMNGRTMMKVTTCRRFAICAMAAVATAGTDALLAAESEEPALAEVLVTATKRGAENIQSVPMAISAYSGDQLQNLGIESFSSIDLKTPGLVFTSNSGTVQPFIRGIGAEFPSSGLEPPVSVYVDDVYWQHAWGSNYDLVDLSTVQVLKGPQGTLYGRNATGGAILITTNDPSHKDEGKILQSVFCVALPQMWSVVSESWPATLRKRRVVLNRPLTSTLWGFNLCLRSG